MRHGCACVDVYLRPVCPRRHKCMRRGVLWPFCAPTADSRTGISWPSGPGNPCRKNSGRYCKPAGIHRIPARHAAGLPVSIGLLVSATGVQSYLGFGGLSPKSSSSCKALLVPPASICWCSYTFCSIHIPAHLLRRDTLPVAGSPSAIKFKQSNALAILWSRRQCYVLRC